MRRLASVFASGLAFVASPALAASVTPVDLDGRTLGAFVVGPVGVTVDSSFVAGEFSTGDFSGGAACPEGFGECVPPQNPPGTVYSFVQTVVPGVDSTPNDPPFADQPPVGDPGVVEAYTVAFRPAGFTGEAGYSFADAEAAGVAFAVSTGPDGSIAFTVTEGEWSAGEGVRFFFDTTQPPSGPGGTYELGGGTAAGPLPAPIPVPASLPLLAGGLLLLAARRRRG
jgi:hypothetical protein